MRSLLSCFLSRSAALVPSFMASYTPSYSYTLSSKAISSACLAFCALERVEVDTLGRPAPDEVLAMGCAGGRSSSSSAAPKTETNAGALADLVRPKADVLGFLDASLAPPNESLTGAKPDMVRRWRCVVEWGWRWMLESGARRAGPGRLAFSAPAEARSLTLTSHRAPTSVLTCPSSALPVSLQAPSRLPARSPLPARDAAARPSSRRRLHRCHQPSATSPARRISHTSHSTTQAILQ